eukprot:2539849-Rhodomonas_salina.1
MVLPGGHAANAQPGTAPEAMLLPRRNQSPKTAFAVHFVPSGRLFVFDFALGFRGEGVVYKFRASVVCRDRVVVLGQAG